MKSNLFKEIAEDFAERLELWESVKVYGADLAFKVFEDYNATGSITCNTYAAREWIAENMLNLGDVVEAMRDGWEYEAGKDIFDNPEKFQVCVYLWVASELCGELESVNEFWNDETELTAEIIEKIRAEIRAILEA